MRIPKLFLLSGLSNELLSYDKHRPFVWLTTNRKEEKDGGKSLSQT